MTNKQGRRYGPRLAGNASSCGSGEDVDVPMGCRSHNNQPGTDQCQSQAGHRLGALWAEPCDGLLSNKICNAGSLRSIESKLMSRA